MTNISPELFKKLDEGRRADVARMLAKKMDPNLPEEARKKIDDALYVIRDQAGYKSVARDREKLRIHTLNGDKEKGDKQAEYMKKTYDRVITGKDII